MQKRSEFFVLRLDPHLSAQDVAGLESEALDLRRGNIHIIIPRHIVGAADKTVSVRKNFQNSVRNLSGIQFVFLFFGNTGFLDPFLLLGHF